MLLHAIQSLVEFLKIRQKPHLSTTIRFSFLPLFLLQSPGIITSIFSLVQEMCEVAPSKRTYFLHGAMWFSSHDSFASTSMD